MPDLISSGAKQIVDVPLRRRPRNASWWRAPQRLWLRRALFQVHLWLGLLLTLYAVVIGISGSVLVFREEIEEAMHGNRLNVQEGPGPRNLERAIRNIEAARPQYVGVGLENFDRRDRAATLLMRPKRGVATSNYRIVSFNPYTGIVLLDQPRYAGVLGWMTNLHFYLLAGEAGLRASGLMALGLLMLCVTGLILWWPGVRRWAAALTLHRRARWQRFNWDLHSVIGFWCSAALAVVSFTGIYFAFPKPVAAMIVWVSGGDSRNATVSEKPESKPDPSRPMLTVDEALRVIGRTLPADAPAGYLQLPSSAVQPYRATGYYRHTAPYSQLVQVAVDSHSGAKLSSSDTRDSSRGMQIIQYFFAIHFGSFGGPGWIGISVKLLWVLLGIAPALLAVTGMLMYWNRKLRPWLRLRMSVSCSVGNNDELQEFSRTRQ